MQTFSSKDKVDRIQAFLSKMIRQTNIIAISFVFIAAHAISSSPAIPGGYSETPRSDYGDLKIKLQNSNLRSALWTENNCVKVLKIDSAYQQVVAGTNYIIRATLSINSVSKNCCFKVYQRLPPNQTFDVQCAQCGGCECFKND